MYAGNHDLTRPYVSTVYGGFKGFPPNHLISGNSGSTVKPYCSDSPQTWAAGVDADLHVYEGLSHGDHAVVANSPESHEHYAECVLVTESPKT